MVRVRWTIVKNNNEILCGYTGNIQFKPIDKVGNSTIKTYLSEKTAINRFNQVFGRLGNSMKYREVYDGVKYKAVKVIEQIDI